MFDLFISYAWTSDSHREWVRLLAGGLHLLGYDIAIDEDVRYGESLNGFMREVVESKHVLLIVDENYKYRADSCPGSGVDYENVWIREVYDDKPSDWLSVLYVRNHKLLLPNWLHDVNPKGFDFNSTPENNDFPGSTQIDELWRWLEGLPASTKHRTSIASLRRKATRLERIDVQRGSGNWANPRLQGKVKFEYTGAPRKTFTVGQGEFEFKISVSEAGPDSIRLYADYVKAVGLIANPATSDCDLDQFITPGRTITPQVGQQAIIMNDHGNLCVITIDKVQREINSTEYIKPYVEFTYRVISDW